MSRTVKTASEFPELNLSVTETIYSSAGEVIETSHNEPITESFFIKTFIFKGSKKIEFPNTNQEPIIIVANSGIAPGPLMIGKKDFKVTILEDDTRDYCVRILKRNYSIDVSTTDLSLGNSSDITKGCIVYVHGTNYKLNDMNYTGSNLFALQNNDVKISATNSCKIYIFRAVIKE